MSRFQISKTARFYVLWLLIALFIYPIAVAIPIVIHIVLNQIPLTLDKIVPLIYLHGYGDRTTLYLTLYVASLGIAQQHLLKRLLSIHIPFWAIGTLFGGAVSMLILHTGQTPFGNSLNLAPWFFGFSLVQAILLFRYTSWALLWVLAHLSISTMFPLSASDSVFNLITQWSIAAGIGGVVTMIVLQLIVTKAIDESPRKKQKHMTYK